MKRTELRIGNIVFRNGEIFEIWDLKRKELELDSEELDRHVNYETYDNISPILLTKEWLLKFGWKYYNGRTSGNLTMDTPCKVDLDFIDGKMQIKSHYESFYRDLNIKYVHQLQNLYFALTGEELTLK